MSVDYQRLLWRCRRGVKELDIVLGNFLEQTYPSLSSEGQRLFAELLEQQDPDLAQWIWGGASVPEKWQLIVYQIQRATDSTRINEGSSGKT